MFWHNGWATLFAAVHVCLGNVREDGEALVLARHRKDPLTDALRRFDRRLPALYAEVRDDLDTRIAQATGPHHLFHVLTEDPPVIARHLPRRREAPSPSSRGGAAAVAIHPVIASPEGARRSTVIARRPSGRRSDPWIASRHGLRPRGSQ